MFSFSVDASAPLARFARTQTYIADFGATVIPAELTAWQVDDMRRQYPNIEQPDNKSAQTHIWPRSRTSSAHRVGTVAGHVGRPKGVKTGEGQKKEPIPLVHGAAHPILRPVLKEQLRTRMNAAMTNKITWAAQQSQTPPQT